MKTLPSLIMTVDDVDLETGRATVKDTLGKRRTIRMDIRKGGGPYPRVGDQWIVAQEAGQWSFDALVRGVPPVIEGDTGGNVALNNTLNALQEMGFIEDDTISTPHLDIPTGAMMMWSTNTAPTGWLICNGSVVNFDTHPELWLLLTTAGYPYGSDAPDGNPRLPDLRTRFPVGVGTGYALGGIGGAATVALTEANLAAHDHPGASHTHTINAPSTPTGNQSANHTHDMAHTHTSPGNTGPDTAVSHSHVEQGFSGRPTSTTGGFSQATTQPLPDADTGTVSTNHTHSIDIPAFASGGASAGPTGSAGSGTAHENRPPYLALNFIIRT